MVNSFCTTVCCSYFLGVVFEVEAFNMARAEQTYRQSGLKSENDKRKHMNSDSFCSYDNLCTT